MDNSDNSRQDPSLKNFLHGAGKYLVGMRKEFEEIKEAGGMDKKCLKYGSTFEGLAGITALFASDTWGLGIAAAIGADFVARFAYGAYVRNGPVPHPGIIGWGREALLYAKEYVMERVREAEDIPHLD